MHPIYDSIGRFIGDLTTPDSLFDISISNLPEGQGAVFNGGEVNPETQYFDKQSESIKSRPEITATANKMEILADGADTFVLSGLPVPCAATVSDLDIETADIVVEVDDGEFGFYTSIAGAYKVKVESFPYISKTWEVLAV